MTADLTAGIVRVLKRDGTTSGTGFVVTDDGLIVTCSHVVWPVGDRKKGLPRPEYVDVVVRSTGDQRRAKVEPAWWRDPDAEDVAVLRLKGPLPEGVEPLPLGSSRGSKGHEFEAFGYPRLGPYEESPARGTILGHVQHPDGWETLLFRSEQISPGMSGAPVLDTVAGWVVGMVNAFPVWKDVTERLIAGDRYGRHAETNFAISTEVLRAVCPALRLPEGCPYRGLQVFEAEHADLYFGREEATRELLDALSRRDFVVLVGVSGSGKSSLVRAGLEKGLREYAIPGLVERPPYLAVPGRNPLLNLALALSQVEGPGLSQVEGPGLADVEGITAAEVTEAFDLPEDALAEGKRRQTANALNGRSPDGVAEAVRACAPPEGLLLIVDQFERLYTECDDDDVRDRFINALLAAAGDRVKVLLALRADYYGLALEHPGLEQVIRQGGQVTPKRMTEADLRAVIEEPARAMGRRFQPGLTERLIADVHERAGDLPLLEFALTELWERDNQRGVLTLVTYEALGYEASDGRYFPGVQGAIAERAEAVWRGLGDGERRAARRVFLNLVTPGPLDEQGERMAEDASRRAWQAEWEETTRRVVRKLVDARLLATGQDPVSDQPTVEVAHEALIRAWPRLQQWLTDYRPFVRWYDAELAPFLRRWLDKEQHPDFLLPEAMLAQAEHWLRRYSDELSGPPANYIQASLEKHERERAARERRRRQLTLAAVGAALVFLVLALLAWRQRNTARKAQAIAVAEAEVRATAQAVAEEQRQIALARQLAAQADMIRLSLPSRRLTRSILLALESFYHHPTLEGYESLREGLTLLPQPVAHIVPAENGSEKSINYYDEQWTVALNHNTLRIEDAVTGRGVAQIASEHNGEDALASENGEWTATVYPDVVRLERVGTGSEVELMHGSRIASVAFSPDGGHIVTGGWDGTARVWEVQTGHQIFQVSHRGRIWSVAFSPDGQSILTSGEDCTARIWEMNTGQETYRMIHNDGVWLAKFSADGKWVVTTLDGMHWGERWVWRVTPASEGLEVEHEQLKAVAFSSDGRWMATAGGDGIVRVWDVSTGQVMTRMVHEDRLRNVAFSPDGQWLAAGSEDGTARVWELMTGQEVTRISHKAGIRALTFSSDGDWLATGSEDGTAQVWEVSTNREIAQIAFEDAVQFMAFSPDGQTIASAVGGTVQVWEIATGKEMARIAQNNDLRIITSIDFSNDGRWMLTGSYDSTARLWETETWQEVAALNHSGSVKSVSFSPDDEWIVTTEYDQSDVLYATRVWEFATRQEIASFSHYGTQCGIFSPDGKWIATASANGTVKLWLWHPQDLITEACARLVRNLTLEEWQQYFPSQDYRPTCPNLPIPEDVNR